MATTNAAEADCTLIESALRCIEHYLQSRPPRLSITSSESAEAECCGGTGGGTTDGGGCACRAAAAGGTAAAAIQKKTGKARAPAKLASLLTESDATQLIQCLIRFTSYKSSLVGYIDASINLLFDTDVFVCLIIPLKLQYILIAYEYRISTHKYSFLM